MKDNQLNFGEAYALMKKGKKITNSRGNILFIESNKVFCIPKSQYPKGKREEIKIYWDAILKDDWKVFED